MPATGTDGPGIHSKFQKPKQPKLTDSPSKSRLDKRGFKRRIHKKKVAIDFRE